MRRDRLALGGILESLQIVAALPEGASPPPCGQTEAVAFVYVLGAQALSGPACSYVGWTLDLGRRLEEHNGKGRRGAKSTRGRVWVLLYAERFESRQAAMRREWALRQDRRFRKALLQSAFALQSA